jgi:hypothetical protein
VRRQRRVTIGPRGEDEGYQRMVESQEPRGSSQRTWLKE